jgi:hypothetical protein
MPPEAKQYAHGMHNTMIYTLYCQSAATLQLLVMTTATYIASLVYYTKYIYVVHAVCVRMHACM